MKLPVLSGSEVIKTLIKAGFKVARRKGSHVILVKFIDGRKIGVVVPDHKEIDKGTLLEIIRQARLKKEEFLELVKK
ncbi:MAG: type II toxin-antitoxin system HicA family toxin [Thermoplasmata archaeon]|nr:type II toxin-antitoxin system HicA family toxin [Thermoplasmata archaeon]